MAALDYTFELVEPGIVFCQAVGDITRASFVDLTQSRVRFADDHHLKAYAFLWDITQTRITIMDVRLAQWATQLDPRLIYVVLIGQRAMAHTFINIVARLTHTQLEMGSSLAAALPVARARVAPHLSDHSR